MLRLLVPLLLVLAAAAVSVADQQDDSSPGQSPGTHRAGRVVLLLVDSMTDTLAEDPQAFPTLAAMRPRALWGRLSGCLPASTVPCARTLLEGSSAGYVAGLSNFSATRAGPASWPVLAAHAGLRVAVASDHTLMNMCDGLGGPRLHFAVEKVPVYHWDEAAAERMADWVRSDAADAYLIHLVDLDKVSHAAGPGTALYQKEVLDADRAIARIAALLSPNDSLIVVGDHGHDQFGCHTPNPGYLAIGPEFATGRVDLRHPTIALLLSAAAGTPLPPSYDGEVPERALRSPYGGSQEDRARIAARVEEARRQRHLDVRAAAHRFMPGLLVALVALVAFALERGKRRPAAVAAVAAAVAATLLGSVWASHGRPLLWQGPARNVLHYAVLVAAFTGLSTLLLGKLSSLDRPARFGVSLLAFPFVVPLVGDDYFGSPTSLAHFFVPALALLLHAELRARSRQAFAAIAAGSLSVALMLGPVPNGEAWLPSAGAALLGGVALAWCGEPARRVRTAALTTLVLLVLGGGMDLGARATLVLALLATTAACATRALGQRASAAVSLVGASAIFLAYWSSLHNLRFEKLRFEFVFDLVPQTGNEALVAVVGAVLTAVKYGLLPWIIATAAPSLANATHGRRLVGWLWLAAFLHAAWVAGAVLDPATRYYEAGVQAACLIALLGLLSLIAVAVQRRAAPASVVAAEAEPNAPGQGAQAGTSS